MVQSLDHKRLHISTDTGTIQVSFLLRQKDVMKKEPLKRRQIVIERHEDQSKKGKETDEKQEKTWM